MGETMTWVQERRQDVIRKVRECMTRDDALSALVPGDLRSLVAEIDELTARNKVLRKKQNELLDEIDALQRRSTMA